MRRYTEPFEALIVHQGFERMISSFTMNDFRKEVLPNFPTEQENRKYMIFYRIEMCKPNSHCPWGYSRWVTGENGRLEMLDNDWDTSG